MEKRATIRDIARTAGVSIATVSRVLNNSVAVTADTKERVTDAVRQLGYIPNSAAISLKTNRTHTVGFVISDIYSEALISAVHAAEAVLNKNNYNLLLCSTANDPVREKRYLQMLMSSNVDGIVINTTGRNPDYILELSQKCPIVLYNRKVPKDDFIGDLVDTNNFLGSYRLTKQLLEIGHRRIAAICGPVHSLSNAKERYEGFQAAMQEAGIQLREDSPYLYGGEFCHQTGECALDHLMALPQPPTAIVSHNVTMSMGFLAQADKRKVRIPEDVSFASYDDIPNAGLMRVRPTAVVFDVKEIGEQIGRAVLKRIDQPGCPNRSFIFDPTIVQGNSVMPPAGEQRPMPTDP